MARCDLCDEHGDLSEIISKWQRDDFYMLCPPCHKKSTDRLFKLMKISNRLMEISFTKWVAKKKGYKR